MTALPSRREAGPSVGAGARVALAVADVNWFTSENLFREVSRENVSTLLLKCRDYRNALQSGVPPWAWGTSLRRKGPALWERDLVLPSGWMKRFPRFGMRPIERSIRTWRESEVGSSELLLVMTYPHYLYLRDKVRPDRSVYFNIDDYSMYWPRFADRVNELERQAVRESDLTVCVSKVRTEQLKAAVPESAGKIRHLPHGAPSFSVAAEPWNRPSPAPPDLVALPRPYLGYIGTLEDRVDWELLSRIAVEFPDASIVIVGKPGPDTRESWSIDRRKCLARPNVHLLGWRPQERISRYNSAFDVCLIPYRTDHPFNRNCSPTKIMDYMGSGRPIVSTDLPECRLYERLFHVAEGTDAFLEAVRSILASDSDDGRASLRLEWARDHTCRKVAHRLLDML
ncbi:MAG: glycosyltransferase [Isosphaeraceae bacterium]